MSQFYLHNEFFHLKLNITTYTIKAIRKLHLKITLDMLKNSKILNKKKFGTR